MTDLLARNITEITAWNSTQDCLEHCGATQRRERERERERERGREGDREGEREREGETW